MKARSLHASPWWRACAARSSSRRCRASTGRSPACGNFCTVVLTERRVHPEKFDFEPVAVMEKLSRARAGIKPPKFRKPQAGQRPRGNFLRRFFYKHLLGVWPPPEPPYTPDPRRPRPPCRRARSLLRGGLQRGRSAPPPRRAARPRLLRAQGGQVPAHDPTLGRPDDRQFSRHGRDGQPPTNGRPTPRPLAEVFAHARLVLARSESLLTRLAETGLPARETASQPHRRSRSNTCRAPSAARLGTATGFSCKPAA